MKFGRAPTTQARRSFFNVLLFNDLLKGHVFTESTITIGQRVANKYDALVPK